MWDERFQKKRLGDRCVAGLAWKDLLNNASVSEKKWYLADPSVREAEAPTPVQGGDTLLYHVSQRSVVPGGTPHLHFCQTNVLFQMTARW